MGCREVCTVFMVTKYVTVVLHSSSRADGNPNNIDVRDVFTVKIFFIGKAYCLTGEL